MQWFICFSPPSPTVYAKPGGWDSAGTCLRGRQNPLFFKLSVKSPKLPSKRQPPTPRSGKMRLSHFREGRILKKKGFFYKSRGNRAFFHRTHPISGGSVKEFSRHPARYKGAAAVPDRNAASFLSQARTTDAPNRMSASLANLKHCFPNGIPMMVMHQTSPTIAHSKKSHIPQSRIHRIFPIIHIRPPSKIPDVPIREPTPASRSSYYYYIASMRIINRIPKKLNFVHIPAGRSLSFSPQGPRTEPLRREKSDYDAFSNWLL